MNTKTNKQTPQSTAEKKSGLFFGPSQMKTGNTCIQPQLTVGPSDDEYEREADAVADQVMRMSSPEQIQTKISPLTVSRKCAFCEEEEKKLQRKSGESKTDQTESQSSIPDVLNSTGNPLDNNVRSFMESRFGYDFSNVKVHTNQVAAKSAQSINALAYTSGNNIVFNNGQYAPQSESGRKLLAHELTHTIQQSTGNGHPIQRTVDRVEVNCGDSEIRFIHDGITTGYHLDHCNVTDNTYDAGVTLGPNTVDFQLGVVPPGTHFDFNYSIGPGQPSPNTFFAGQSRVTVHCSNTPSTGLGSNIHFNARQLSAEDFLSLTGLTVDSIPEGIMVPLGNFVDDTLPSIIGPAVTGASHFSPTPWSFIPRNTTGILWSQGHTSVWSNPEGLLSTPTIRGYRGNLGYYMGEMLPVVGRNFTVRLHEGVPGSFANDAWFPIMPGEQYYIFAPQSAEQAQAFAQRLQTTEYGGEYTYSPPRAPGAPDPILGPVGRTEGSLHSELTSRGRAPMCTNNCITVPTPEIEAAIGGRPATSSGVDLMTGMRPDGTIDPHYAGRGRLMTDAMGEGPLPPGAGRLNIRVTPGGSAGMFVIRGAGRVMLVYGIYSTEERIRESIGTGHTATVITEEAGSWTLGILGSALGGAAAGAVFCAPTGPIDAVCVVGGFLGGLLFGAVGSAAGHAGGHELGERVVTPVVDSVIDRAAELESSWTREIYNLYGVPHF